MQHFNIGSDSITWMSIFLCLCSNAYHMHGSVNGCTEAGLTVPRRVSTSLVLKHLPCPNLHSATCLASHPLAPKLLLFHLGPGLTPRSHTWHLFLITAFYCLSWWEFRFSFWPCFQHFQRLFVLRMPTNSVCLNSVSRTQTFNGKKKQEWENGLFEKKNRVPYIEQQDFGAHNKCSEIKDS